MKVREGGICPSGGQEFRPMPGTRSFIYSWCTHSLLISTEETSFSFSPPKRRSQCWLVSLDRVTLSSWPLSRQPVVHLYLRGTALTKTLALFGNSLSFALPNKINLKRLSSSDTFPLRSMRSCEREGLLETVSRLSAWSPRPSPVLSICSAFRGMHLG